MRAWMVAVVVVAGCKSAGKSAEPSAVAPQGPNLVRVTTATVLAADDPPPFLLLVDDAGKVRLGAAASWTDVAKPLAKTIAADLDAIDKRIREARALNQTPMRVLAEWDPNVPLDLTAFDDKRTGVTQDDPPPPPPEDRPDDGRDESGGTGTAMALDEGKMGKKDSDRAEGQYKMKKDSDRAEGQYKMKKDVQGRGPRLGLALAQLPPASSDTPARLALVVGEVIESGKLEDVRSVILAPPTLKADKLIELVTRMEAAIAVVHDGTVRPLRINFTRSHDDYTDEPGPGLEVRVSTKGVVIEAVPDVPIETTLEPKALAATLEKARTTRGTKTSELDVLVDADVDSQRLVDVLAALDTAGVRMIGMGHAPTADQLKLRGHRTPSVTLGQPNAQGDLDKAEIRKVMRASKPQFLACYTKALASQSTLSGTVSALFAISPQGAVTNVSADGVDPAVATCVQDVIKTLAFPKPKSGEVQVNYPLTMHP